MELAYCLFCILICYCRRLKKYTEEFVWTFKLVSLFVFASDFKINIQNNNLKKQQTSNILLLKDQNWAEGYLQSFLLRNVQDIIMYSEICESLSWQVMMKHNLREQCDIF